MYGLTTEEIQELLTKYDQGEMIRNLAKKFKLTSIKVHNILVAHELIKDDSYDGFCLREYKMTSKEYLARQWNITLIKW